MSRYLSAPQDVSDKLNEIREEHFPELVNCHIMVLMDTKKRKSKGRYVFASIKKMSDCERFLSADNFVTEGYDYLMVIDNNMWQNISDEDKIRLVFHELCHIFIDNEAKNPYKTVDHDITGFKKEFDTFSDIMETWERLSEISESIYEEK